MQGADVELEFPTPDSRLKNESVVLWSVSVVVSVIDVRHRVGGRACAVDHSCVPAQGPLRHVLRW